MVNEFAHILPNEILGLPPTKEVEFAIDLALGIASISRASYPMALIELRELKTLL